MHLLRWIRFVIGYVFISSGTLKLLVVDFKVMFANLGLPFPESTLFLVAIIEIVCGAFIVAELYVRNATVPLIVIMISALWIAKLPIFLKQGFLSFVFESRLDIVMLILLFLLWQHYKGGYKYG